MAPLKLSLVLCICLTAVIDTQANQSCDKSVDGCEGDFHENKYAPVSDGLEHLDWSAIRKDLDENGWTVVPDVLSIQKADEYAKQLQQWIDSMPEDGFPETWTSGVIKSHNAHQHEVAWHVRLEAKRVFSRLWGTEKLLSSTDRIAICRPPEQLQWENLYTTLGENGMMHYDQGPLRLGLHAWQSAVYLEEAAEDDFTLAVMTGSHKYYQEFFEVFPATESEHRPLTDDEIKWFLETKKVSIHRAIIPKGGMVVWDSRTVHAGAPPKLPRANPSRWRYTVFVCMSPAAWARPEDMENKREAYENLNGTWHWPSYGVKLFPPLGAPTAYDIKELPDIARTDAAKEIAGIKEYNFDDGEPNGPPAPSWLSEYPKGGLKDGVDPY